MILYIHATLNTLHGYNDDNTSLIKVRGGFPDFTFTKDNDDPLSLHDGSFKFKRNRTYRFADYGISRRFLVYANSEYTALTPLFANPINYDYSNMENWTNENWNEDLQDELDEYIEKGDDLEIGRAHV